MFLRSFIDIMYDKDLSFNFQKKKCNFIVLCEFFQGCGIRRLEHLFLLPRAVLPATEAAES